jgi:hypothetical protein
VEAGVPAFRDPRRRVWYVGDRHIRLPAFVPQRLPRQRARRRVCQEQLEEALKVGRLELVELDLGQCPVIGVEQMVQVAPQALDRTHRRQGR